MSLQALQLAVRYGKRQALEPTSFAATGGTLIGLIGPNGAGKSTLMRALVGLVPRQGDCVWQGRPLGSLGARERARTIAYLPQGAAVHWPLRVRGLVELGRLPHRSFGAPPAAADRAAVDAALAEADVTELQERSVAELSMGERARVLLARALAVRAPMLLVDEPIAMLDPFHQLQIMQVLRGYAHAAGGAGERRVVIAVLHDLGVAGRFCDRLLLLERGRLVADGAPRAVLTPPVLREHYRVEGWQPADGEPPIVPWRIVDGR